MAEIEHTENLNNEIIYVQEKWVNCPVEAEKKAQADETVLLLTLDGTDYFQKKDNLIILSLGREFQVLSGRLIKMDYRKESHYQILKEYLSKCNVVIDTVVNAIGLEKKQKEIKLTDSVFYATTLECYLLKYLLKMWSGDFYYLFWKNQQNAYQDYAQTGIFGVLANEMPAISFHCIGIDEKVSYEMIQLEKGEKASCVVYEKGSRYVREFQEYEAVDTKTMDWTGKTVIMTGGFGGIGTSLAKEVLSFPEVNLLCVGRSKVESEKVEKCKSELNQHKNSSSKIRYISCDISDEKELKVLIDEIKEEYGRADVLLHLAGVLRDRLALHKTELDINDVILPKITLLKYMDLLVEKLAVKSAVLFSSISSVTGTVGQLDYAYANATFNYFAKFYKNSSITVTSLAWPLWKSNGMMALEAVKQKMEQGGFSILLKESGIHILNQFIGIKGTYLIFTGNQEKMRKSLRLSKEENRGWEAKKNTMKPEEIFSKKVIDFVKESIAAITHHMVEQIDDYDDFEALGIDSIKMIDITEVMEKEIGDLPKTLFFDCQNVTQLADYLLENKAESFKNIRKETEAVTLTSEVESKKEEEDWEEEFSFDLHMIDSERDSQKTSNDEREPVAIIAMDGKFPMADNLEEFWENLRSGKDCIEIVPKSRFDYEEIYDPESKKIGKTNCKWGGFVSNMEYFDAEFFHYAPIEAAMIDPQERLFLETAWNTMEHAGYTRNQLRQSKVGVFVGVSFGHYQSLSAKMDGNDLQAVSSYSSIANRVSYFLDLTGPSMAVDTMCSSSGTAIHLACESIWNKESDLAFAGGVNLTIGAQKYKVLSTKNYLSSDGRCRSFGDGGDGYVPGEGVGCLLLKPLSKAVEDGDNIEAVILSTNINHGGKSTGYSVPKPALQAELIRDGVEKSGLSVEDITYIETHGTGTPLGDPIEIQGLTEGMDIANHPDAQFYIGSVKSNVGHLESAAAVTAIMKVILQMKHKELVPSLHSTQLNKNIDFEKLPFEVIQNNKTWNTKKINAYPQLELCATVSSFGAGGSNAFFVLGDYYSAKNAIVSEDKLMIVPVSARTIKALVENVQNLYRAISKGEDSYLDICYTLQTGREEMSERVAFIVSNKKELLVEMKHFCEGDTNRSIVTGVCEKKKNASGTLEDNQALRALQIGDFNQAAKCWCEGYVLDWNYFYEGVTQKRQRICLPSYSFQKKRFWISDYDTGGQENEHRKVTNEMIDYNLSTMERQIYKKELTGKEDYIKDHIVNGNAMMPGAAMIEMARTAAQMALEGIGTAGKIYDVIFSKALLFGNQQKELYIEFYQKKNALEFELYEKKEIEEVVYCTGSIGFEKLVKEAPSVSLEKWNEEKWDAQKEEIYQLFHDGGFEYGTFYQTLQGVRREEDTVYAKMTIPSVKKSYGLHPALLDGAFQTVGMMLSESAEGREYMPYRVNSVEWYHPFTGDCYIKTVQTLKDERHRSFQIEIFDEEGMLAAVLTGYTLLLLSHTLKPEEKKEALKNTKQVPDADVRKKVKSFLYQAIAKETGMRPESIQENETFETYGIDSVISMRITDRIREVFEEVSATILYDVKEVGTLIDCLIQEFPNTVMDYFTVKSSKEIVSEEKVAQKQDSFYPKRRNRNHKQYNSNEDIAIIGVDGRYPGSDNLDEFWKNLVESKDCVIEVPKERWDYRKLYTPNKNAKGKIYSKWGGFIHGAEEFDAEFFGIIPLQAMIMDPQERIYLQTAWHCVEEAGYSLKSLEKYKVGVYTGEMWGDYQKIGIEETLKGNPVSLSSSYASTSNKVSYIMNLHGPSMTIDTMCSSSLTSILLACNALCERKIDMALAGGVNLTLHSDKYLSLCQGKFLSIDGKCRSFGEGGDGYVPGEGVGCILLKRVSDAKRDGDHIYAVIKGTAINHGGRSNAYFVPNVEEQKNLIIEALEQADISPRSISSVEAHGTGTALGDPIEVAGFTKAYGLYTNDKEYCSLGSVKSNIGHCESAAGIAAVTKVLLELKNKKLVPSIHSDVLNKKIDFEKSPFYVQHNYEDWKRPVILENGLETEYPRRAAISAFGAGGTNVHIIMEEALNEQNVRIAESKKRLYLFSAKKKSQLFELMQNYQTYLAEQKFNDEREESVYLSDLCGTLLFGREHFKVRAAIVAETVQELKDAVNDFLMKKENINLFQDNAETETFISEIFDDEEGKEYLNALLSAKNFNKLGIYWTKGIDLDEDAIFDESYQKLSIPLYPFEKNVIAIKRTEGEYLKSLKIHPMLEKNVSTIRQQMFSMNFAGDEFYLEDHKVNGVSILPGVAYMEMMRAAAEFSTEGGIVSKVKDVLFKRPLQVAGSPVDACISLIPNGTYLDCKVETVNTSAIHTECASCRLELVKDDPNWISSEYLDPSLYEERCKIAVQKDEFYDKFKEMDFVYGLRMQGMNQALVSEDSKYAIVRVEEKETLENVSEYVLHPTILDAGVQAVAVTISGEDASYLPYSVAELEILAPSSGVEKIYIEKIGKKENDTISFHMIYTDADNKVLLKMKDLRVKKQSSVANQSEMHYYTTKLVEKKIIKSTVTGKSNILLFDENTELYKMWNKSNSNIALVLPGKQYEKINDLEYVCSSCDEQAYVKLFRDVLVKHDIDIIVYKAASIKEGFEPDYVRNMFILMKSLILTESRKDIVFIHAFEGMIKDRNRMDANPEFLAFAGLFKTASQESVHLYCKNVAVSTTLFKESMKLAQVLEKECSKPSEKVEESYYNSTDKKYVRTMDEVSMGENPMKPVSPERKGLRKDGVYVITGGLHGVGYLFAEYLAKKYRPSIALIGRSSLDETGRAKLDALKNNGANVSYFSGDVNDRESIQTCFSQIYDRFGSVTGVIHGAGIKKDEIIVNKSAVTFMNTIKPKVNGLNHLYEAVKKQPLEFFVMFSSIAGLMGNIGQADYAYGNNYMDAFASVNQFPFVSINWPYWKNGGMTLRQSDIDAMKARNGMLPLETKDGISAFEFILEHIHSLSHMLVLPTIHGFGENQAKTNKETSRKKLEAKKTKAVLTVPMKQTAANGTKENAEAYVKDIISEETKLEAAKIDSAQHFDSYGFDSVMTMNMTARLDENFPDITKTLFYETHNINELVVYLEETYPEEYNNFFGSTEDMETEQEYEDSEAEEVHTFEREPIVFKDPELEHENAEEIEEYAIIGMELKVPGADNLDQFWKNLMDGVNTLTDIPKDRFDYEEYYSEDSTAIGKTYSKTGGFIEGVRDFDPVFFKMAPNSVMFIDPMERMLLEGTWHLLEHAGIAPSDLRGKYVGVFLGAMWQQYQMLLMNGPGQGMIPSLFSNLSNRLSSFYDWHGPSITLDTMCSSSLTSLKLAMDSIKNKECECAIVGGINLSLHPSKFINLSKGGLLSHHDRCLPYAEDADGYLTSEGLGLVMVKSLKQAIKDGDKIHLVVKSAAMLHSGKGGGFMVPNSKMQAEVVKQALIKADICVESIGYLESQGICTKVGDAIEFKAMKEVFAEETKKKSFCALGSAKYVIGHTEAASGVIALIKIALQMKYHKIPGMLADETLNHEINCSDTPFYIPRKPIDWEPTHHSDQEELLRAGLNGFGGGGNYLHIILEEYKSKELVNRPDQVREQAIVVSAMTETSLRNNVQALVRNAQRGIKCIDNQSEMQNLIAKIAGLGNDSISKDTTFQEIGLGTKGYLALWEELKKTESTNMDLNELSQLKYVGELCNACEKKDSGMSQKEFEAMAYTLQNGRDSFPKKVLFIAKNVQEFIQMATQYLTGEAPKEIILCTGKDKIENNRLKELAESWLRTGKANWNSYYANGKPQKISLPGYIFDNQKYWIPEEYIVKTYPAKEQEMLERKEIEKQQELDSTKETVCIVEETERAISENGKDELVKAVAEVIGIDPDSIEHDKNLAEYGLDSFLGQKLFQELAARTNQPILYSTFSEELTINNIFDKLVNDLDKDIDIVLKQEPQEENELSEAEILAKLEKGELSVEEALEMGDIND